MAASATSYIIFTALKRPATRSVPEKEACIACMRVEQSAKYSDSRSTGVLLRKLTWGRTVGYGYVSLYEGCGILPVRDNDSGFPIPQIGNFVWASKLYPSSSLQSQCAEQYWHRPLHEQDMWGRLSCVQIQLPAPLVAGREMAFACCEYVQ